MKGKDNYSLDVRIEESGTAVGFAVEKCVQEIMTVKGWDHPIEAIQLLIEHLVAAAAMVGVPPINILESCMAAAQAGERASQSIDMEKLVEKAKMRSLDKNKTKGH